jgi:hypothetical protein
MVSTSSHTIVFGGASMSRDALGTGYKKIISSMNDAGVSNGYFKEGNSGGGNYMKDKLSGKA